MKAAKTFVADEVRKMLEEYVGFISDEADEKIDELVELVADDPRNQEGT